MTKKEIRTKISKKIREIETVEKMEKYPQVSQDFKTVLSQEKKRLQYEIEQLQERYEKVKN